MGRNRLARGVRHDREERGAAGWGIVSVLVLVILLPGCGNQPAAPLAPAATAPFELQVKFANVDTGMHVYTAVATLSPGDATHITLDFWDIELEPADAYRAVGHVSREGLEGLGIAIELYGSAELVPGSYIFGSEYPDCCVPSIVSGDVEYQLLPDPHHPGQVQLESVDLTEGGQIHGNIDLECYYGEIIRGSFTATVHLR